MTCQEFSRGLVAIAFGVVATAATCQAVGPVWDDRPDVAPPSPSLESSAPGSAGRSVDGSSPSNVLEDVPRGMGGTQAPTDCNTEVGQAPKVCRRWRAIANTL
jgi:hypothetical protein